ncbi:MAG: MSHA biogenesis protein MshJ, partial [Psychromonas sp.]|nr:MSHA biogenesis protein MshJ [Psychromonas sp.]
DYNAIYQYLLNVESLQEKFYWYSLDYQVSNYPLAEVTIQIYTLSDQRDLVSG